MQARKLVLAMSATLLAAAFGPVAETAYGAGPDTDRVMVKFKHGAKDKVKNKVKGAKGRIHHELDRNDVVAASIPVDELDALKADPDVLAVEIDAPRYPMAETTPWGITRVQAAEAIAAGADGDGIKVCVIDSGAYSGHEDFAGVPMTGHTDEGGDWSSDSCGHGTHVAGTIAAAANDTGVIGVSPDGKVSLHIVKVFDTLECEWTYSSDLIAAAEECQEAGADIINMSLGGAYSSTFERDAFDQLYAEGVLSIAASGNDWNTNYNYPASYDSVVSVAAIDENNARAVFSQYNDQVELSAPGVGVLSTESWRDSHLVVDDDTVDSQPFNGTLEATAAGELVDGGDCGVASDWAGKVVLCERGSVPFWDMTVNVTDAGGAAVLIYNNDEFGYILGWLGPGNTSTIPVLSLTQENGQALAAGHLGQWAEVSSAFEQDVNAYGYNDGTSMATPHVAGVAALVWSAAPEKSNRDVRTALGATAIDLGQPGYDVETGWGLVQAADAAAELQNGSGGAVPGSAPRFLIASSEWAKNNALDTTLFWTAGEGAVDIVRNDEVIMAGIVNTGTAAYSDKPKGDGTWLYKVCNAGTSDCSNTTTVNFDGRDVPPNNNGKWSKDAARSLVLATGESDQGWPRLASMAGGDTYVTWQHSGGEFDVHLQRIDRKGRAQWKAGDLLVADRNLMFITVHGMDLATDTRDNALVSFRVNDAEGTAQAWVQKVSPDGEKLWGDEGIVVSDSPENVLTARVVGTTDGGAVVLWQDNVSLFLQKYDADGNALWGDESIEVLKPGPFAEFYRFGVGGFEASGDGGVVISFKSALGRFGNGLWAQKYDADGQPVWDPEHVRVFDDSSLGGMPEGTAPEIVTDGEGGAVFCWRYTFGVSSTDVRVQRVTADGTMLFADNGVPVSTDDTLDRGDATCSYDADTGDIYVGFMQRNAGFTAHGIAAQRFDAAGNRLWGDTGREILPMSPGSKGAVNTLPADNGAIFAWGLNERPAPMYLQASGLDANGEFAWDDQIISFKTAPSWISRPVATIDADGRAYFAWPEYISADDQDVMMQSINAEGRIGK